MTTRRGQRGAVLITSLLLLLVLTIIGVTAMQMSRMQERMSGSARDLNLSFQGAEAGLRDGELALFTLLDRPNTCTSAPCRYWEAGTVVDAGGDLIDPGTADAAWWAANGVEYGENVVGTSGPQDITELDEDPLFVVEWLAFVKEGPGAGDGVPTGRDFYRITARSTGGSGRAETILQSTFTRRF